MERITFIIRTNKTKGRIRLRFRLIDGRNVQLYHKSQIRADIEDLKKFNTDGTLKSRVTKYNALLHTSINNEIEKIRHAYRLLKEEDLFCHLSSRFLEEKIDRISKPPLQNPAQCGHTETLLERYERFLDSLKEYGSLSHSRIITYLTVRDKLRRFLEIFKNANCSIYDFRAEDILAFKSFMTEEYKYAGKFPLIYKDLDRRSLPAKPLGNNTVVLKLRALSTFFNELENNDEIDKSPFRRLAKNRRLAMMREQYDEPFALTSAELQDIMATEVTEELKETKDAFLLHCALGCRVGDFMKLNMQNVAVTGDGVPYVHYIAAKTSGTSSGRKEKSTPLMLLALEIIKRRRFRFDMFNRSHNKAVTLYNKRIRLLLQHCNITRPIGKYDETTQTVCQIPLWSVASSKLCRKTHIDMASKIQINMYATGLHESGSTAVSHYSKLSLPDLFHLLCLAFCQPQYHTDKNLNIIDKTNR